MYNIILFDLDGTLTQSEQGITNAIIYALGEMDIKEDNREKIKKFIGPPLAETFMKFYGLDANDTQKAVKHCQEYMKKKGIYEAPLYEGVEKILNTLKDMEKTLYVATSKPELLARQILKYIKIDNLFTDIVGSNMDGTRTKKDEVICFLLEKNDIVEKSNVIMVGDREHDILGSKKVGISSIGVLYGYGDYAELENAGADYIIEKIEDIIEIV